MILDGGSDSTLSGVQLALTAAVVGVILLVGLVILVVALV